MFKTVNGWTKERMKVQIRLKNNGARSIRSSGGYCAYRGAEGNACAAGCFIPDEVYNYAMEGQSVSRLRDFNLCKFPLERNGIMLLQSAHDNADIGANMHDVLCEWIDKNVEDGQ